MSVVPAGTEVPYTVTWLEMTARPSYDWPSAPSSPPVSLLRAHEPPSWYFRALYDAVGRDYVWEDMPQVGDPALAEWFDPGHMRLYTLLGDGWPYGFFLLDLSGGDSTTEAETVTDLSYFGLVPEAVGKGLGRWFLRTAILTAWERDGLDRLTVNTCTLDHPRALSMYQKAGFSPVRQSDHTRILKHDRDLARIPD